MDDLSVFNGALKSLGFDINDCPYPPIKEEWETFPIVQAIRQVEKNTGINYNTINMP